MWKAINTPVVIAIIIAITYLGTSYLPYHMKAKEQRLRQTSSVNRQHTSQAQPSSNSRLKPVYPELSGRDKGVLATKPHIITSSPKIFITKNSSYVRFTCEVENTSDKYIKDLSLSFTITEDDKVVDIGSARSENMTILEPNKKELLVFNTRTNCPRDEKAKKEFLEKLTVKVSVGSFTPYVYTKADKTEDDG